MTIMSTSILATIGDKRRFLYIEGIEIVTPAGNIPLQIYPASSGTNGDVGKLVSIYCRVPCLKRS